MITGALVTSPMPPTETALESMRLHEAPDFTPEPPELNRITIDNPDVFRNSEDEVSHAWDLANLWQPASHPALMRGRVRRPTLRTPLTTTNDSLRPSVTVGTSTRQEVTRTSPGRFLIDPRLDRRHPNGRPFDVRRPVKFRRPGLVDLFGCLLRDQAPKFRTPPGQSSGALVMAPAPWSSNRRWLRIRVQDRRRPADHDRLAFCLA